MSRYSTSKQIKDENGSRRVNTTIVPPVPKSDLDTYIQVTSPERLDKLAYEFYNDASQWWIIAAANGLGKGTLAVPEGSRIRIPSKTAIQDLISNTNKER